MVSRLFFGNFDFEHRLSEAIYEPTAKLKRLNAELAAAWLSIADDGDWLWTPLPIDEAFFTEMRRLGMPNVKPITSVSVVPSDVEFIPWGWSIEVRLLADRFGWDTSACSEKAAHLANSRATSEELERTWGVGLREARRIESLDELKTSIRSLHQSDARWVVKAEYGMSARERILGRGPMTIPDENWVRRRLDLNGVVFFEPWVERIDEIGIQIDIPAIGSPKLVGVTPMLVDRRGQYAGNWFAYSDERFENQQRFWAEATEVAIRAATHLQSIGYFGPLGIDAMIYRDVDGTIRVRPLQDINARWTMGRLSLGWQRLLEPREEGCWIHGSVNELTQLSQFDVARTVTTSPKQAGGVPCHHASQVLIG